MPRTAQRGGPQTRARIREVANGLFIEHGYDAVTVAEVARAAGVSSVTVFNHFPRKEDLFFDRDEEGREMLREALRQRDPGVTPIEALRLLAHRLAAERSPFAEFSVASQGFVDTIARSETLKARARAIRDEFAQVVAAALCACAGRAPEDVDARLAASLLLATWTTARLQAHQVFQQTGDAGQAKALFLAVVDRGSAGVAAAMVGTPYA